MRPDVRERVSASKVLIRRYRDEYGLSFREAQLLAVDEATYLRYERGEVSLKQARQLAGITGPRPSGGGH